jgi:hypothetical protein
LREEVRDQEGAEYLREALRNGGSIRLNGGEERPS